MREEDQKLSREFKNYLFQMGAKLVGFGDISKLSNTPFTVGVSIAIPFPEMAVTDILNGPTVAYYNIHQQMNLYLNKIANCGECFLEERGYHAVAQTTDRIRFDSNGDVDIPHKTIATRSGIGWIGKNCLLVTKEFGPAIRLTSILTNAPLILEEPINASYCGMCQRCVDACPAKALKNTLWTIDTTRDQILNRDTCRIEQEDYMEKHTGIRIALCGKCIVSCPYAEKYLNL